MKTQTQILGDKINKKKEVQETKIDKYISGDGDWVENYINQPKYMTLVCSNYFENGDDLILIHETENPSKDPGSAIVCRGKWNDGIWPE